MKFQKEFLIVGGGVVLLAIVVWSLMTTKSPVAFVNDTHIPARDTEMMMKKVDMPTEEMMVKEEVDVLFADDLVDDIDFDAEMAAFETLEEDITFDDIEL